MPQFKVVLVEPLNDGNIGAIARSMRNFGLEELVLVRPCFVGEEAIKRAMHGIDILRNARTVFTEADAFAGCDFIAATSGVATSNEKNFTRIALTPRAFAEKVKGSDSKIALVFGREDFGLDRELIKRCDFLITIPADPGYSILNVSHAAAVVFYELFAGGAAEWKARPAGEVEKEKLYEYFAMLLDAIDYPEHKKEKTKVMFRRLMARAVPTTWEFHTLMGVLDGAVKKSTHGALPKKRCGKKG
ncbi:MAG: RNA methyltransferase [Thermoplasmata archaeon]